jgi:hypothetical protein
VGQVQKDLNALLYDFMALAALDVGHHSNTAVGMVELRAVKTTASSLVSEKVMLSSCHG